MSQKIDLNTVKDPEQVVKEAMKNISAPLWGSNLDEFVKDIRFKRGKFEISINLPVPIKTTSIKEDFDKALKNLTNYVSGIIKIETTYVSKINSLNDIEVGNVLLSNVKNIIAVASNKGGVGKSTVSANIAAALSYLGAKVALLDLDIYGPNVPNMFGVTTRPRYYDKLINPIERYGVELMSVGFMIENEASPVILRAPLVNRIVMEFFQEIRWGDIDYMVIDLPPGTGDIQLTLAQQLTNARVLFVTTPQDVALADVYKGVRMFQQEGISLTVLGVVENMSYFICDGCGKRHEIFDHGGAKAVADTFGIRLYGEIPLMTDLRVSGDKGKPIVFENPSHPVSQAFIDITQKLVLDIALKNHEAMGRSDRVVIPLDLN